MNYSFRFWAIFHIIIFLLVALDLLIFRKSPQKPSLWRAGLWSGVWIFFALSFNFWIYTQKGYEPALQFFTCYVIEKSLSADNLFVFCLIFSSLKISSKYHHKVLYWGVFGALVMRITLILLGVSAIKRFDWLYFVLGGFLSLAALRLGWSCFKKQSTISIPLYGFIEKHLPKPLNDTENGRFFVLRGRKFSITHLFVALIMIEVADVVFALDSLPAVLGITTDTFIVYTSNVFAILGLRSLYFVIQHFQQRSSVFTLALSLILLFVGGKMLASKWWHIDILTSLFIIIGIFSGAYMLSLFCSRRQNLGS